MCGEVERAGLEGGWLGEFVEGGVSAGQSDCVAGEGRELGEQAFVAVAGIAGAGAFGGGFALRGGRAAGFGDWVCLDGWCLVFEEQRRPGEAQMSGEVVG